MSDRDEPTKANGDMEDDIGSPIAEGRRSASPVRRDRSESPAAQSKSASPAARGRSASRSKERSRSPRPRTDSRSPRPRSYSRSPLARDRSRSRSRPRRRSLSRDRRASPYRRRRSPSPRRYRSRSRDRGYGGYGGYGGGYGRRRSPPPTYRRRSPPPPRRRRTPPTRGLHLFVAGLNFIMTDREVERKFDKYGDVAEARIVRNPMNGESRGFGFVEMKTEEGADKAIRDLDGADWEGRRLLVERARNVR